MKNLLYLVLASFICLISCGCPDCDSAPDPLRIIFVDANGDDFLLNQPVEIEEISFCDSSEQIDFDLSNLSEGGVVINTGIQMELQTLWDNCTTADCCIVIDFSDESSDTVMYRITEMEEECCSSFSTTRFDFNGADFLASSNQNDVGAFVVVK